MPPPAKAIAFIAALSLLSRLAAALVLGNQVVPLPGVYDQVSYHNLALRLLGGHGFTFAQAWWPNTPAGETTAHWSYLYTGMLAAIYAVSNAAPLAARLLQAAAAGVLLPWFAYRLARRVFAGLEEPAATRVGLLAAALSAGYGYFIYYSAVLMTEALYIAAILWVFDCTLRLAAARPDGSRLAWLGWLELGLALALTLLLRQVFLTFVPLLFLWLLWSAWRARGSLGAAVLHTARGGLLAGLVLAALILPITLHNYRQFNRLVLINTNAGFAFYWANHPVHGDRFVPILTSDMPSYNELLPASLAGLNEAESDSHLLGLGLGFVLDDPARYLRLSLSRVPVYFMFWPSPESRPLSNIVRVGSFGLALPFMLAGLALWLAGGGPRGPGVLLLLFALAYSLVHIFSWTLIRYRLPVDAVMLIFAARAVAPAWGWLEARLARARAAPAPA